jgi:two-component system nitrate/nitrite response regulator NarP
MSTSLVLKYCVDIFSAVVRANAGLIGVPACISDPAPSLSAKGRKSYDETTREIPAEESMGARRADRSPTDPTEVLLIDPRRLQRELLSFVLHQEQDLTVACSSAEDASARIAQQQPSVVLMSFGPAHDNGVRLLTTLRAEHLGLQALVLAPKASDQTILAYAKAGASGCLTELTEPAVLAHAIREVAAGKVLFGPNVLGRLLRRSETTRAGARSPLGLRELEVLQEFATGAGVEEVAARLEIRPHTVRTHMKNILAKLDAHSRIAAVMIALNAGWVKLPETDEGRPEGPIRRACAPHHGTPSTNFS